MRNKVTMQQIADTAGVSKFAVSRALTGKSGVSEQTREMIIRTAGQLGYFKNGAVHSKIMQEGTGKEQSPPEQRKMTGTIVVIFPNIRHQNMDSLYWGPVFEGISSRLNEKGLDILTLTEPSSEKIFSLLNPDAIQGIITVGTVSVSLLLELQRLKIPVVMVDHIEPVFHCDTVFSDNITLMREVMNRLISRGYQKYQFVGQIKEAQSFMERWVAYRMALDEHGLDCPQNEALLHFQDDVEMLRTIDQISADELPDVFVCVNDITARFVIEHLEKQGLTVPECCSVTGFDNVETDLPILATVDVNKALLGKRAVDQLLWRMNHIASPYEKLLIYADLVFRENYAVSR
ncbi:LacI family DNA-binding transcriptional regulator [Neobacillus mesonae]|nr:LacI family DNA-binding transcriptional regulator [Neobacillus mesonae]